MTENQMNEWRLNESEEHLPPWRQREIALLILEQKALDEAPKPARATGRAILKRVTFAAFDGRSVLGHTSVDLIDDIDDHHFRCNVDEQGAQEIARALSGVFDEIVKVRFTVELVDP